MARNSIDFQTIRSEGGLLPPDLMRRVLDPQEKLEGTRAEDYGLSPGERLNEAITISWNRLRKHWAEFRAAAASLPQGEAATGLTNDRWSLPLLRELGFGLLPTTAGPEIGGRIYAINRFFGPVPVHLVGCGLSLDHRAAGVRGAAAANPHGLVQEFLNRSPSHLWAIVANGLRLRILRDNQALSRQSFLEFDLEAMFAGEVYSDFVLLWLMAHATRFAPRDGGQPESCWLEQWAKQAEEQGTRALGDLRGGVERALQVLGEGFTSHSKNVLLRDALRTGQVSLSDFHSQLLRVVYRLIFLFVAEDRTIDGQALLHPPDESDAARLARERYAAHYSTARLRELASRIKGSRHGDLWRQLQIFTGALSGDVRFAAARTQLALPELGSFLWDPAFTASLNDAELTNFDFLEALRNLAFTRQGKVLRPVDYKNLGAEELGGVYESLLALTPQISADGARFSFAEFAGNERKTSGSYYTPDSLVQCLLDSALDPVVAEAIKGKAGDEAVKAILALKVCDPAVGSGHFLVGAAHRLARHLARVRASAQGESEPSPLRYQQALRDVIGRCLYGVDLSPMAAELCRVSLWLEALEPGKPLSFLDHHIRVGNSLLGATPDLIAAGLPDDAFTAIEEDDPKACALLKKRNKGERRGWGPLFAQLDAETQAHLQEAASALQEMPDDRPEETRAKELAFRRHEQTEEYRQKKHLSDAWCAAFLIRKGFREPGREGSVIGITQGQLNGLAEGRALPSELEADVERLSHQYRFLHWHLAFPEVFAKGGFDLVVGNPPYLNAIEQKDAGLSGCKAFWGIRFASASGAYDLYVLFLELAQQLLRSHARAALLTPNKYLAAPYAEGLRELFSQRHCLVEIIDVSRTDAFADASVYPLISTLAASSLGIDVPVVAKLQAKAGVDFDVLMHERAFIESLPDYNWGVLLSRGAHLIRRMQASGTQLGRMLEICASTTAAEADAFSQLLSEETDRQGRAGWKVVNTGLIDPFESLWGQQEIRHNKKSFHRPWLTYSHDTVSSRRAQQYSRSKLIFAKLALQIEAFFDENGEYAALNTNFAFAERDEGYFYLGQLHSTLASWAYLQLFGALSMGGGYVQFQAPQLKAMLVIPYQVDDPLHCRLSSLARNASLEPRNCNLRKEIDDVVGTLFGISSEELARAQVSE